MKSARDLSCPKKFASVNDLNRIHSTWNSLEGLRDIPKNVQSWIPIFTLLLKWGFVGIKVPLIALTEAHLQSNTGANRSISSTKRALKWLEDNGWIYRRKLRIGYNRFITTIFLKREKFRFFLKRLDSETCSTTSHVSPLSSEKTFSDLTSTSSPPLRSIDSNATPAKSKPRAKSAENVTCSTTSHVSPLSSEKTFSDLTSTSSPPLRSIDSNATPAKSKPRAKSAEFKNRTKHYQNPIRYTCFLLLADSPDKKRVLRRLDAELDGKTHRNTLDWQYWVTRWPNMTHAEREFYASTDIIPALKNAIWPKPKPKITKKVAAKPKPDRIAHRKDFSTDEQEEIVRIQHFLDQQRANQEKING